MCCWIHSYSHHTYTHTWIHIKTRQSLRPSILRHHTSAQTDGRVTTCFQELDAIVFPRDLSPPHVATNHQWQMLHRTLLSRQTAGMFVNKILQMSLPDCTRLKWPQPLSTNWVAQCAVRVLCRHGLFAKFVKIVCKHLAMYSSLRCTVVILTSGIL